jgi:hypothetical protein
VSASSVKETPRLGLPPRPHASLPKYSNAYPAKCKNARRKLALTHTQAHSKACTHTHTSALAHIHTHIYWHSHGRQTKCSNTTCTPTHAHTHTHNTHTHMHNLMPAPIPSAKRAPRHSTSPAEDKGTRKIRKLAVDDI